MSIAGFSPVGSAIVGTAGFLGPLEDFTFVSGPVALQNRSAEDFMTDIYTQIATEVAVDLRREGCTQSIAITAKTRPDQPLWARQELAGRLVIKRANIGRLPAVSPITYEQDIAALIARADEALGLIVARGPSAAATDYRVASYHNHPAELRRDWAGIMADAGTGASFDTGPIRAKLVEALGMLDGAET